MASGGRSQLKMSEESFDFICNTCEKLGKTAKAVKYCVECAGYCCQPCTDIHQAFPALKNHSLMEVDQANQASGQQPDVLEFPTERCSIHKGKVVDMFCESHQAVGCYVCMGIDHKMCQQNHIHSIPDMIDTLFKPSDCKQIQRLLKDAMVSMETISQSKEDHLQELKKSKGEAMGKVDTFQKALETILRQAAECSKKEVESVYKQLERKFLDEKQTADGARDNLKITNDKLKKSEANRAQRFVCNKIGEGNIKLADKIRKDLSQLQNAEPEFEFVPDQSLMDFMKGLRGIGRVQKNECTHDPSPRPHHDLYKVKNSRDINIKLPDDTSQCYSTGSCLTQDNRLLVTDYNNKKLKLVDLQKMSVVDYCCLDSYPHGVCSISKYEVAVACSYSNTIQFVSFRNKMSVTRTINTSHECYGIGYYDNKLFVTDCGQSLYVYNMTALTGTLLNTITQDSDGKKMFDQSRHVALNEQGTRLFVGGGDKRDVVCFDGSGKYMSTISCADQRRVDGVFVDSDANLFVVDGSHAGSVHQYNSEDGRKVGVIVEGLQYPQSVCFHTGMKTMFVITDYSHVVKMYELE